MMTPEQRKSISEKLLHKRGIRINLQLPLTEDDDEVVLRSPEQLTRRMIALWAVSETAREPEGRQFYDVFVTRQIESWLSPQELAFLRGDERDENDFIQFAAKRESLFFLAWCGGLVEPIQIPLAASNLVPIAALFPQAMEDPAVLINAIRIRPKKEIMDWADLLYRLHWSVRHAGLIGKAMPGKLDGGIVKGWHHAVNWMTNYEEEENWDHVSTET